MNIDNLLEKQENAILEGNSYFLQCYEYARKNINNQRQFFYLVRNIGALCRLEYKKEMNILTQICDNSCSYQSELKQMHDFIDIGTMHKQLESEKVCSYKYFQQNPSNFYVGLHEDVLQTLFYKKFNNSTFIFEDAHDLPLKLEKAMSIQITNVYITNCCKSFLKQISQPITWHQQLNNRMQFLAKNFKSNRQSSQIITISQEQYDILIPLVSFGIRVIQDYGELGEQLQIDSNQSQQIISNCTNAISNEQFIDYCKSINISIQNLNLKPKYQKLTFENYEKYLELIFQQQYHQKILLNQWYILIKTAFEISNQNQEIEYKADTSFHMDQEGEIIEKFSIEKTIPSNECQLNFDYKLIIFTDILQNKLNFTLQCFNPQLGMKILQQCGIKNIIIISKHIHPHKLYKTELNQIFQYYPQIPIDQCNLQIKIINKLNNYNIDLTNKSDQNQELMIFELGKQIQILNLQLVEHAVIVLFSSKSFMQRCQDIWSQQNILQKISGSKEFTWQKYIQKKTISDIFRIFLNKCRFNNVTKDTPPTLYTICNDLTLDSINEQIEELMYKNDKIYISLTPITVLLIGVPWASQFLYYNDQQIFEQQAQFQLNLKLDWLMNSKNQYDRKYFSMVMAIRNLSRIKWILSQLSNCTLLCLDEKFEQKALWNDSQIPQSINLQTLIKECQKQQTQIVRSEHLKQNQESTQKINTIKSNIRIHIQPPQQQQQQQQQQFNGTKRKIMLNKFQLSDYYGGVKKQLPIQESEKITIDEVIGISDEKQQTNYNEQEQQQQCVICWNYEQNKIMCKSSKCGHIACQDCWKNWLSTKLECPLCRARVREKFLIQL